MLKDQPSCVINGGTTTQYFNIERRSNQGDSISAYLVILMLEILFLFIETSWNKRHRDISVLYYLYCLCRWCSVLSERFTTHWIPSWNIHCFFIFSGLKTNLTKCETVGIGALKLAVCGMKCIDLRNEAIIILGTYFSYSNTIIHLPKSWFHCVNCTKTLKISKSYSWWKNNCF